MATSHNKGWEILKEGFCPWQTMPFYNATIHGNPEDGIFLCISQTYPGFRDNFGHNFLRCEPKDCKKVLPTIIKLYKTGNANLFDKVEKYFKPVPTIKDRFILPDGDAVVPGDFIEITWQPHYAKKPLSRIMVVGPIYDDDLFYDTDGHYVQREDIKSVRKITDLLCVKERPEKDIEKLRNNHDFLGARIFGYGYKPDNIKAFDISLADCYKPSGFVLFVCSKGNYKKSHIVESRFITEPIKEIMLPE